MFPHSRWLAAVGTLLCALSSCALVTSKYEQTVDLHRRLSHAKALEKSAQYAAAAREYGQIAEAFPESLYYKKTVRKAGLLSIHPDNPNIDLEAALHWFNVLIALRISAAEKQDVRMHIALIERIIKQQQTIHKLGHGQEKLVSSSAEQQKQLAQRDKQIRQLRSELSWTREELRKMKEVDVQLHKSRTKGLVQ